MFLSTMILVSSLNFQTQVTNIVKANPKLVGKIVTVCVEEQCVTVDRSNDVINRLEKEPMVETENTFGQVLNSVLEKVGGAHGSVSVEYKESTKGADGSEHTVEVKVEVSAGTGSGK